MLFLSASTSCVRASLRGTCPVVGQRISTNKHRLLRHQSRTLFSLFKKKDSVDSLANKQKQQPVLTQDNLFHPFSRSPFPALRERGEAIKKLAPCPVCSVGHAQGHPHVTRKNVAFECPDCGWPTHCSEEHWRQDSEHHRYCGRLRESNEDEHDLRSGRKIVEFDLPGPIAYDEAVSFANWDVFWYTRGFPSMDTERARRHASKLLTYPMSIASVLHQNSGLTLSNQRVTPEGIRSLAAMRMTLHVPPGGPETEEAGVGKPTFRIFILGARAESSLPVHVWDQLSLLFPSVSIHLHFIGPQVSLPQIKKLKEEKGSTGQTTPGSPTPESTSQRTSQPSKTSRTETTGSSPGISTQSTEIDAQQKPNYLPNVYQPPTPPPVPVLKYTRSSIDVYGVPSYTAPYSHQFTVTGIQAPYQDVHASLADTLDPYSDVFFLFSPGLGFPSPSGALSPNGEPMLQVNDPETWGETLPLLLRSKCAIFVTGFSPADVERDVRALARAPGVAGEFDWVITPGENAFGSEKWEVADFDPRVMVKTNWGIWGIRGKRRDIREWEE